MSISGQESGEGFSIVVTDILRFLCYAYTFSSPTVPLYSMYFCLLSFFFSSPLRRLSEQSRMLADHKRLMGDLKDQYTDARDWNLRYKAAFKGIHGSELGVCINAPLELGEGCLSSVSLCSSVCHTLSVWIQDTLHFSMSLKYCMWWWCN